MMLNITTTTFNKTNLTVIININYVKVSSYYNPNKRNTSYFGAESANINNMNSTLTN